MTFAAEKLDIEEYRQALKLKPDLENGRKLYRVCMVCHGPEGQGTANGIYPQIAGQLRQVVIKQLTDFRAGNRDNPIMTPFSSLAMLGGAQQIADVAAYVEQLKMTPYNNKGTGVDLQFGKQIYQKYCSECHGENGEGDAEIHIPLLHGQHYNYLVRQFNWIRSGQRRNADRDMVKLIQAFSIREVAAVMDYLSRLSPHPDKMAEPEWTNPDMPDFVRGDHLPALQKQQQTPLLKPNFPENHE